MSYEEDMMNNIKFYDERSRQRIDASCPRVLVDARISSTKTVKVIAGVFRSTELDIDTHQTARCPETYRYTIDDVSNQVLESWDIIDKPIPPWDQ